jgi:CRISPR-associated endonuclease Cas3-HD
VAKTTPSGQPGLSVQEHCEHVGAVAKALHQRLPDATKRQIPNDVISLVALHDIGKVSPGFQKKILRDSPDRLPSELIQRSIAGFDIDHAQISEASLISWLRGKPNHSSSTEKWAEVLGNHHGKRTNSKQDDIEPYGGMSWQKERHQLLAQLLDKLGPLPSEPPESPQHLRGGEPRRHRGIPHMRGDGPLMPHIFPVRNGVFPICVGMVLIHCFFSKFFEFKWNRHSCIL